MRAMRSGKRTVVEAAGSRFAVAAVPRKKQQACQAAKMRRRLMFCSWLHLGQEETMMEEIAAVKLLIVCLAVMMARTTEKQRKQNKHMAWRTKQTAPHTAGMHNTCDSRNPVCHEAHDSLTTADQH